MVAGQTRWPHLNQIELNEIKAFCSTQQDVIYAFKQHISFQIFLSNYLKAWSKRDNIENLTVKRSAASCSHLQGLGRKTWLMIASRLWLRLLSFIKLSLFDKWCLFCLHHDGTSNDPSLGFYPRKGQRETLKTKEMGRPLLPASAPSHNPHELSLLFWQESRHWISKKSWNWQNSQKSI